LDAFINDEATKRAQPRVSQVQSAADRRAAELEKDIEAARGATADIQRQLRELQTQGLSEEERAAVMAKFAQDDRTAELKAWEEKLTSYHRTLYTGSLVMDYGQYGLTAEELEGIETPEEMEAFALEKRATFLEAKLQELQGATPAAAAAAPAAPEAAPAPAATPPAQPPANVPAGAGAPSDVGGGGTPPADNQPSTERTSKALANNLAGLSWNSVSIRPPAR
jgi:hypothetical protein